MKNLLILFLFFPVFGFGQNQANVKQLLLENKIYSVDTLKEIFVDRINKYGNKGFNWKMEKDAKLIYSMGTYGGSIYTIGYRPLGLEDIDWWELDLSTNEWDLLRKKIRTIILTNEGNLDEPFKRENKSTAIDSILMTVRIKNLSTIKELSALAEINIIEPGDDYGFFYTAGFLEYYIKQSDKKTKFPNEEFSPFQDEKGVVKQYQLSNKRVVYQNKELVNCDPKSFRRFGGFYFGDTSKIYWTDRLLADVDYKTFTHENGVTKDKNHVYSREKIIVGADPNLFGLVDSTRRREYASHNYYKDEHHVYHRRVKLKKADINSFELLTWKEKEDEVGSNWWARDKNHVYFQGYLVKGADPKTIKLMNKGHAKDKGNYLMGRLAIPYDSINFEVFPNNMIRDKNHVYFASKILKDADPLSFIYLNDFYQKDKNHVFHRGKILLDADPHTFKISTNENYSFDKNNVFYQKGKLKEVDLKTWEWLSDNYSKDQFTVYYRYVIIKGADVASFKVTGTGKIKKGQDKNGTYHQNILLKNSSDKKEKND